MEKITLTLGEIITLEAELNGFTQPETKERLLQGLLSSNLNLAKKYWLTKLSEKCQEEKKIIDSLRDELIRKHGKESNGQVVIELFSDKKRTKPNPNYIKFQEEYVALLNEKKEIEYIMPLTLSDLESIDTKENYAIVFKLIKEDDGE